MPEQRNLEGALFFLPMGKILKGAKFGLPGLPQKLGLLSRKALLLAEQRSIPVVYDMAEWVARFSWMARHPRVAYTLRRMRRDPTPFDLEIEAGSEVAQTFLSLRGARGVDVLGEGAEDLSGIFNTHPALHRRVHELFNATREETTRYLADVQASVDMVRAHRAFRTDLNLARRFDLWLDQAGNDSRLIEELLSGSGKRSLFREQQVFDRFFKVKQEAALRRSMFADAAGEQIGEQFRVGMRMDIMRGKKELIRSDFFQERLEGLKQKLRSSELEGLAEEIHLRRETSSFFEDYDSFASQRGIPTGFGSPMRFQIRKDREQDFLNFLTEVPKRLGTLEPGQLMLIQEEDQDFRVEALSAPVVRELEKSDPNLRDLALENR